jgi:DNA-binding NarL/FixJ family response regulator
MTSSVLLVDDDPAFRRLVRRTLDGAGLVVIAEAETVAEAGEAVQRVQPDVVLVDVGLPDGDGVTLAKELVALPWAPRIVLTSSDPDAATPEEVALSGALGFVPKSELPGRGLSLMLGRS